MDSINYILSKARKTIKNEGITSLTKKATRYLKVNAKVERQKCKDVLFINGCSLPHPSRYRVNHQREQLEANGLSTDQVYYENLTLILCKEVFNLNVLVSAAIAFTVSVIFNYILSIKWVFDVDKSKSEKKNFVIFIVFSIIGLLLTELIMWVGTDILKVNYLLVKIIATAIVMVFNFITRKLFLE